MTRSIEKFWGKTVLATIIGLVPFCGAMAYDWVTTGHVSDIEATYLPGNIIFSLDAQTNGSSCAVQWEGKSYQGASQYPQPIM